MLIVLTIIILLLLIALIFFIMKSIKQQRKLDKKISNCEVRNYRLKEENQLLDISNKILKQQVDDKEDKQDTFSTPNGTIEKLDNFKGKKALIGDYSCSSYYNTKNVLLSLGFDIDIIGSISEIENAIREGKKYDVIFSNNIYRFGTGEELLKNLKSMDGFTTPIILHSVTKDLKEYALKVGFNGVLPKPIVQKDTITLLNTLLNMKQEGIT